MRITTGGLGAEIITALAAGPLAVGDLRRKLRVRRQTLLRELSALCAAGQIIKSSQHKTGVDGRPRRVSLFGLTNGRSGGGSCTPYGGSGALIPPHTELAGTAATGTGAADAEHAAKDELREETI